LCWRVQIKNALLAACASLLLTAGVDGAAKPQYGGVLRVELRASSVTLNPQRWRAGSPEYAANERLAELVFDRLVTLDNYGKFQPGIATDWNHDVSAKHWQFTLRPGVKFSDGTALTPGDVVKALQPMLPRGVQISATASGVVVQSANPTYDLLEVLASGPYFVCKVDGKGFLSGTGPFVIEGSPPSAQVNERSGTGSGVSAAQHIRFRYNDGYWGGRPYLDAIDVALGVAPLRALLDIQLGKADLSELSEDTARRAQQVNLRLWASSALTLYAVRFATRAKSPNEQMLREALSLSLDRQAMARVLLQKQAEPAVAFLPQWLSGYAFFFDMDSNLEGAKSLRAKLPVNAVGASQPLRVAIDGNNELSKLIGERIVVNARSAGLALQMITKTGVAQTGDLAGTKTETDAQLVAWRYTSLSPRDALEGMAVAWRWEIPEGGAPADADARYAWEKRMMDERNLLPLVAVPDFAAADARVRNWSPAPWGEWRLADVWLVQAEAAGTARDATAKSETRARP
jgi:ABC-type transport system substrate-binding protein